MVGDTNRLAQALMNLVSNAIQYTPEGGTVEVTVGRENGAALVSVSDTGTGISDEDQRHLFCKFFRADHAMAREAGGIGLGLVIARGIVEQHGGTLRVVSEVNEGSTFTVSLPATDPPHGGP